MGPPLPDHLVDLIESGVSIFVGTRDAQLRPASTRAFGAVCAPDRRHVTVYLPEGTSARVIADLDENRQLAVGFSRNLDHLTFQLKGVVTERRLATDGERVVPERYLAAFAEQLSLTGFPRATVRRVNAWPAWAVTFEVRDVFVQTPGPGAGGRLELGR